MDLIYIRTLTVLGHYVGFFYGDITSASIGTDICKCSDHKLTTMTSRSTTILAIASLTVVGGFLAYAVYFDYKRRNDVLFRKQLRKSFLFLRLYFLD